MIVYQITLTNEFISFFLYVHSENLDINTLNYKQWLSSWHEIVGKRKSFTFFILHWYILAVFNDKVLFLLYSAKTLEILPFQKEGVKEGKKEEKVKWWGFQVKRKNYLLLLNFTWILIPLINQMHLPIPEPRDFWEALTHSSFPLHSVLQTLLQCILKCEPSHITPLAKTFVIPIALRLKSKFLILTYKMLHDAALINVFISLISLFQ